MYMSCILSKDFEDSISHRSDDDMDGVGGGRQADSVSDDDDDDGPTVRPKVFSFAGVCLAFLSAWGCS